MAVLFNNFIEYVIKKNIEIKYNFVFVYTSHWALIRHKTKKNVSKVLFSIPKSMAQ